MKILQSCCSASWGGLEILALQTTLRLMARGHELRLLCCNNSTLFTEAVKQNIPVLAVPYQKIPGIRSVRKVKKILINGNFDVVHTHLSRDLWLLVPALKMADSKSKLFLTRHMGSGVSKKDVLHRMLYNRLTRIFAISNYVRQSVLNTCPISEEKVSVIHPALELNRYTPSHYNKAEIKKSLNIKKDCIVIGMASRFSHGKGHEEFLKAAKILKDEFKDGLCFLVAGGVSFGEEHYHEKILKMAGELGLNNTVKFTGHSSDITEILSVMDIFVLPSHEESFGILLTEAMAMGLPVAASNNAGIPDIVIDNETGILVPPKNAGALALALKKLASSSELRASLGKAGRIRAKGIFNIDTALDKLENFYAG